jgi:NitT/TauT family transport system substrate-binding protein
MKPIYGLRRLIAGATLRALCVALAMVATAPASQSQTLPYRFRVAAENPQYEWFYLVVDSGKAQGIWAKYGLDPDFVVAAASAVQLEEQVNAGVNLGFVNTAEALLARSAGAPVKIVAAYFGETTARIFVARDSAIRSVKELDRKRIGIVAKTHTSYRTVLFLNKKLDIKAEPVPLGNLKNNLAALKAGDIDALYSAEGAALALASNGQIRRLLPLADIYPSPYAAVVVWTTDDFIRSNPDTVRRFVHATLEVVEFLRTHPADAGQLYMNHTGASKDVADKAVESLLKVLCPRGQGSGRDLVAAVKGNWQFVTASSADSADMQFKIEDAVDARFLP